jgi:hypothetical protein
MATHEDITEREELNARLKNQYELGKAQEETLRVRTSSSTPPSTTCRRGCFFDSDHRLIAATTASRDL